MNFIEQITEFYLMSHVQYIQIQKLNIIMTKYSKTKKKSLQKLSTDQIAPWLLSLHLTWIIFLDITAQYSTFVDNYSL